MPNHKPYGKTVILCLYSVIVPFLGFFLGCSSSPPEIIRLKYQVNAFYDQQYKLKYERLSVFLQVNDLDGIDDLAELVIGNATAGISWTLTKDSWETMGQPDETWIGSNALVMYDYARIPEGTYTVTTTDLAGYAKETSFSISGPQIELGTLVFPAISFGDDVATLTSQEPVLAWFYASTGEYLYGQQLAPGIINLALLDQPGTNGMRPERLYLYTYNEDRGFGIVSGPFRFP